MGREIFTLLEMVMEVQQYQVKVPPLSPLSLQFSQYTHTMAFWCGLVTTKHCFVEQGCCLDLYGKITFTKFPVVVVVVFCTVKSNFLNPPNTTVSQCYVLYASSSHILLLWAASCWS